MGKIRAPSWLQQVVPPVLWQWLHRGDGRRQSARRPATARPREPGREQPPEFYDQTFLERDEWRHHYTGSTYYPIWTVLADRIRRDGIASILEIGCGTGQLAQLLRDQGLGRYLGFDFSPERLNYAKASCPQLAFVIADALTTDLFARHDYDGVLCTEFLEHIERDLEVLGKIRPGAHFYGTVPNFPSRAHVRFFEGPAQVAERYAPSFDPFSVTVHLANEKGKMFFIIDGVKR